MSPGVARVKVVGAAREGRLAPGPDGPMLAGVISRLRTSIAIALALVVTLFTLGRVPVSWTGGPGSPDGAEDPGRAVAARALPPGPAANG
jgi:hypothetical protein